MNILYTVNEDGEVVVVSSNYKTSKRELTDKTEEILSLENTIEALDSQKSIINDEIQTTEEKIKSQGTWNRSINILFGGTVTALAVGCGISTTLLSLPITGSLYLVSKAVTTELKKMNKASKEGLIAERNAIEASQNAYRNYIRELQEQAKSLAFEENKKAGFKMLESKGEEYWRSLQDADEAFNARYEQAFVEEFTASQKNKPKVLTILTPKKKK